ncbi:MAG: glycosyltransferase family 4 protein [Erythrobacter sp.]
MTAVLVDAYNIAMPHGTGVATYGRGLASAATSLGQQVHLLFGAKAGHSKVPLLNEIALAEGDGGKPASALAGLLPGRIAQATSGVVSARRAKPIAMSGDVILPQPLRVEGAQYWNASRLYSHAHGAFKVSGRLSRVTGPQVDIAHWTYPLPVKLPGAANIYTLHDLVPLRLPYTTADKKRTYYKLCRAIVDQADHILTVSESARSDIIRMLGADEAQVTNLYQSSDIADVLRDVPRDAVVGEVEGLLSAPERGFYLFFGALEPKKNVARLLQAYLSSQSRYPLVIVGAEGWGSERDVALLKQMSALDKSNRIKWLGYLPRQMLASVISCARATIFPSLYEGFGLPVLESMMLGTPVITGNTSSLPEVAGDAALLVDPYDTRAIMRAILELENDDRAVADMSQAGLQQAAKFSRERYAERLAGFHRRFTGSEIAQGAN